MKTKHAEGKWEAIETKLGYDIICTELDGIKTLVAKVVDYHDPYDYEKEKANAELVAAAPGLLKALIGMIDWAKNTAMYYLQDEELLPKGLESWENLIKE